MKRIVGCLLAGFAALAWAHVEEQLSFDLPSGVYRCAYGIELVGVERISSEGEAARVRIQPKGDKIHELNRSLSSSGLPRFESAEAGLVWIDLPWKSVLLSAASQKPLASDCTHAPELALAALQGAAETVKPTKKRSRTAASAAKKRPEARLETKKSRS